MKATLIISTEYRLNSPSVFAHIGNRYFGDLVYVLSRKPESVDYWRGATCSDSDRFFTVKEGEISEEQLAQLIDVEIKLIETRNSMIHQRLTYPIHNGYKIKRGKLWDAYYQQYLKFSKEYEYVNDHNTPLRITERELYRKRKQILLNISK